MDNDQTVCILKASFSKKGITISSYTKENGAEDNLSLVFNRLKKHVRNSGSSLVIFSAAIENSVTFDLQMPQLAAKDINGAIKMELPRFIPFSSDEVEFSSRFVAIEEKHQTLRVTAWPSGGRRKYEELLAANGINIDIWLDPFQAADPAMANEQIYLPTYDRDFALSAPDEKKMRNFIQAEPDSSSKTFSDMLKNVIKGADGMGAEFSPAMLLALYAFNGTFKRDNKILALPPKKLRIKRYFAVKAAIIFLLAVNIISVISLIVRMDYQRYQEYKSYSSKVAALQRKIKITNKELKRIKQDSKNVNKMIDDASRELPLCDILHDIAKVTPAESSLDRFSLSNGSLNISFRGGPEVENLQTSIENIKYIKVDSAQRRNWRNIRHMLSLRIKRAEKNDKSDKGEKSDKNNNIENVEKSDKNNNVEKTVKSDKLDNKDNSDKSNNVEKSDKTGKNDSKDKNVKQGTVK